MLSMKKPWHPHSIDLLVASVQYDFMAPSIQVKMGLGLLKITECFFHQFRLWSKFNYKSLFSELLAPF